MNEFLEIAAHDAFTTMMNLDFAGGDGSMGTEIPELKARAEQLMLDIKAYAESQGVELDF